MLCLLCAAALFLRRQTSPCQLRSNKPAHQCVITSVLALLKYCIAQICLLGAWMQYTYILMSCTPAICPEPNMEKLDHWLLVQHPHSSCYWSSKLPVHFYTARFSEINHRPQSKRHTHPFFHIKGVSVRSVLCKPVLIRYTWPSGTKAQLWLIETTNKERSLSPRSLRNRRQGRHRTEIAKGQGGRPVVRAHLSHSLCTCMLTHTDAQTRTDASFTGL